MAVIWEQKGTLSHTPTPTPPSDLLPLTATGASATCSWIIHLLHKCNYITTLISDGQRPIPRDASFPNIAEKKYHTPQSRSVVTTKAHQVQYFSMLQRRLADVLEHQVWALPESHISLLAVASNGMKLALWGTFTTSKESLQSLLLRFHPLLDIHALTCCL